LSRDWGRERKGEQINSRKKGLENGVQKEKLYKKMISKEGKKRKKGEKDQALC